MVPGDVADRVVLLRSFDTRAGGAIDVPDPYYDDQAGFSQCLAMIETACQGLVSALVHELRAGGTSAEASRPRPGLNRSPGRPY